MKFKSKGLLLILLSAVSVAGVFLFKPIPQPLAYHDFADKRPFAGIPNFLNVITNLPFIFAGLYGMFLLKKSIAEKKIKLEYTFLFVGILLTGFGSAYYHIHPDNNTLVWDRIPMTIAFMALLAASISEFINGRLGATLLLPLLLLGVGSVVYWHLTELRGSGDMRLYGVVQFYPVIFIPLILLLFPSSTFTSGVQPLVWTMVWYIVAKLCEHFDRLIYASLHFISGHSLKHLAATLSAWYLVKLFRIKHVRLI